MAHNSSSMPTFSPPDEDDELHKRAERMGWNPTDLSTAPQWIQNIGGMDPSRIQNKAAQNPRIGFFSRALLGGGGGGSVPFGDVAVPPPALPTSPPPGGDGGNFPMPPVPRGPDAPVPEGPTGPFTPRGAPGRVNLRSLDRRSGPPAPPVPPPTGLGPGPGFDFQAPRYGEGDVDAPGPAPIPGISGGPGFDFRPPRYDENGVAVPRARDLPAPGPGPDFGLDALREYRQRAGAPEARPVTRAPSAPDFMDIADVPDPQDYPQYQTPEGGIRGQQLGEQMSGFAQQAMENPTRFDIPFVEQVTELIDQELGEQREEGLKRLGEQMSGRGLVGSSVEAEQRAEMEENLERQRMERLANLERLIAATAAGDRATAANIAQGAGQLQRGLGADVRGEALREFQTGRQQARDRESDIRARAGLQLEGGSLADRAGLSRAELLERSRGRQFGEEMAGAQFQEGQERFGVRTGMDRARLGLSADQMRAMDELRRAREGRARAGQEFGQEMAGAEFGEGQERFGARLGIDAARLGLTADQMASRDELARAGFREGALNRRFGQRMAGREFEEGQRRFGAGLGLDTARTGLRADELQALDEMRRAQFGEDVARRTFGQGMQRAQFGEGQRRFDTRTDLDSRAQELQAQGMNLDEAYRRAALEQEAELTTRGQDIRERQIEQNQRMEALSMIIRALAAVGVEVWPDKDPDNGDPPECPPGMVWNGRTCVKVKENGGENGEENGKKEEEEDDRNPASIAPTGLNPIPAETQRHARQRDWDPTDLSTAPEWIQDLEGMDPSRIQNKVQQNPRVRFFAPALLRQTRRR